MQVMPHSERDRQTLDKSFLPKLLADDIAGYEKMRQMNPRDARLRVALGYGYREAGRVDDAIAEFAEAARLEPTAERHYALASAYVESRNLTEAAAEFTEAARLKPDSAEAMYGLGVVRQQQGRLDEAIDFYRRAIAGHLQFADAHYNLGRALATQGKADEAIAEYRRGLELRPDDAEAHRSLAAALASTNRAEDAVTEYRKALTLEPDQAGALLDLAWILATSDQPGLRNPAEAVRLAERVTELTNHQNASVLDTLAAAYAAAGRIEAAISTAVDAVRLAVQVGDSELARRAQERLDFYRRSSR